MDARLLEPGILRYPEEAFISGRVLMVFVLSIKLTAVSPSSLSFAACSDVLIFSLRQQ
jgi:hypothetical protein